MSLHQPTWYTPYPGLPLLQSKQRSQQDAENTTCRGLQCLQCCTDRTAAGIMISLQRIAAGIVQTQSVRQTKILIILLSRFEKNCGTNLKCTRDLSSELSTVRSDNLSFLLSINYIPLTTEPQKTIYGFNKIKGIVLVSQIIFLRTRALGREWKFVLSPGWCDEECWWPARTVRSVGVIPPLHRIVSHYVTLTNPRYR